MPFQAHLDGQSRECGATTIVSGQNFVYIDGKLWAVEGDKNSHEEGGLIATTGNSIYINGKLVIVHGPDPAEIDLLGHVGLDDGTAEGTSTVYCY